MRKGAQMSYDSLKVYLDDERAYENLVLPHFAELFRVRNLIAMLNED